MIENLIRFRITVMTPNDVAKAVIKALKVDKNGAFFAVFGDSCLIEYPHLDNQIFDMAFKLGRVAKILGFEILHPWQIYLILLLLIAALFQIPLATFLCFIWN